MYSRLIDGIEYDFGVSGKLVRNVMVMYDRQTKSLWSQLLGESIEGELIGSKLEYLPSFQTTWEAWKELHPDTLALEKGYYGDLDPYKSYYSSNSAGVIGEKFNDDRLEIKEYVIGVEIEGFAIAFPFSELSIMPVVNYQHKKIGILIVFNPDTALGIAFDPIVDGRILNFEYIDEQTIKDIETDTIWDSLSGIAINGELQGKTLSRIKSTSSFWFGWKDFHPGTFIYGQLP